MGLFPNAAHVLLRSLSGSSLISGVPSVTVFESGKNGTTLISSVFKLRGMIRYGICSPRHFFGRVYSVFELRGTVRYSALFVFLGICLSGKRCSVFGRRGTLRSFVFTVLRRAVRYSGFWVPKRRTKPRWVGRRQHAAVLKKY